jgi:hypothetical protein
MAAGSSTSGTENTDRIARVGTTRGATLER